VISRYKQPYGWIKTAGLQYSSNEKKLIKIEQGILREYTGILKPVLKQCNPVLTAPPPPPGRLLARTVPTKSRTAILRSYQTASTSE
jgi:hypothetical protein